MRSQRFDYKVIDTTHGKKLCIMWGGDYDAYPNGIKDLPWEDTHRSMYDPDWNDAHENIAHGKIDEPCWHIDYTKTAIQLFERMFSVRVPAEHKPDTSNQGQVEIIIPKGQSQFYLNEPTTEQDNILDSEFSYEEPNAEYTNAYKRGEWDGIVHVYDTHRHTAPIGLLERAVAVLDEEGHEVKVKDERTVSGTPIDTDWLGESLRPYQCRAVERVEEQNGGVIAIPTGGGKTYVACSLIHKFRMRAGKAMVIVHTKELLYQWADEVRELLGVEPGLIGDGQWEEGDEVTIAIGQTITSRGSHLLDDDYGNLIFDECHRTSAADTFHEIGMSLNVKTRIGLSATPWRRVTGEELLIEGAVGSQAYHVSPEQLVDEGYLAEPSFEILDPHDYGDPREASGGEDYHAAYERCIETDPIRNLAIAEKAAEMAADGRQVLINVNRVAQGILLELMLNYEADEDELLSQIDDAQKRRQAQQAFDSIGLVSLDQARMIHASTSDRDEILERFSNGDQQIIISTLVKEGVDIPELDGVILAHGGKSSVETIQVIGRALRPSSDDAMIVDVKDEGNYFADAHQQRLQTLHDYYGKYYDLDAFRGDLTQEMTEEQEDELLDSFLD